MSQTQFWQPTPTYQDQFAAPDLPPSVHTQESDPQDDAASLPRDGQYDIDPAEQTLAIRDEDSIVFRHSGWAPTRGRVREALAASDAPQSRELAFDACGSKAYILESICEPGHYKIASSKCKDRFCKPCARERAGAVARNLLDHVDDKQLRFITLTLKTQTPNLTFELDRLYKAFQALRRRQFWKRHVTGGAALLEVKHNERSDRWHPHLHILVEGTYVPHTKLQAEWRAVTGDSFIVDVRAVKDNQRVTQYICKYATDPIDRSIGRRVDLLIQAINAFKGRKTCLTFGSWRGVVLATANDKTGWRHITTLHRLMSDARAGQAAAVKILGTLWVYQENTEKRKRTAVTRSRPPPDPDLFTL